MAGVRSMEVLHFMGWIRASSVILTRRYHRPIIGVVPYHPSLSLSDVT